MHNKDYDFYGYEIDMKKDGGDAWQSLANLTGDVRTYMARGLEPSTAYALRVRARMQLGGYTTYSNAATMKTQALGELAQQCITSMLIASRLLTPSWHLVPRNMAGTASLPASSLMLPASRFLTPASYCIIPTFRLQNSLVTVAFHI